MAALSRRDEPKAPEDGLRLRPAYFSQEYSAWWEGKHGFPPGSLEVAYRYHIPQAQVEAVHRCLIYYGIEVDEYGAYAYPPHNVWGTKAWKARLDENITYNSSHARLMRRAKAAEEQARIDEQGEGGGDDEDPMPDALPPRIQTPDFGRRGMEDWGIRNFVEDFDNHEDELTRPPTPLARRPRPGTSPERPGSDATRNSPGHGRRGSIQSSPRTPPGRSSLHAVPQAPRPIRVAQRPMYAPTPGIGRRAHVRERENPLTRRRRSPESNDHVGTARNVTAPTPARRTPPLPGYVARFARKTPPPSYEPGPAQPSPAPPHQAAVPRAFPLRQLHVAQSSNDAPTRQDVDAWYAPPGPYPSLHRSNAHRDPGTAGPSRRTIPRKPVSNRRRSYSQSPPGARGQRRSPRIAENRVQKRSP